MIQGMNIDSHNFDNITVTKSELAQLKTLVKQVREEFNFGSQTALGKKLEHLASFVAGLDNVPRKNVD